MGDLTALQALLLREGGIGWEGKGEREGKKGGEGRKGPPCVSLKFKFSLE